MPYHYVIEITQRLEQLLGPSTKMKGMWGYTTRHQLPFDAFVTFSDDSRECCVELSGTTCAILGEAEVLKLAHWALWNCGKPTRCDVSIDFHANHPTRPLDLIDTVHAACESRQLCRCRRWEARQPRTANGAYTGRGINLGARGKNGSGRYIRLYDKGLETETKPPRTWERWETEFTQDAALQVVKQLVLSGEHWKHTALQLALGAVEFREHTGERSLKRRPLAAWWSDFLEGVEPVCVKIKHLQTNLDRYGAWLRRSVFKTLTTMSRKTGLTLDELADWFIGEVPFPPSDAPVIQELLQAISPAEMPENAPAPQAPWK